MKPKALLKTGVALASGLVLAATAAGPVAADHPDPLPRPFQAEDAGEDACTFFETDGDAAFAAAHPPEDERIEIWGEALITHAPHGTPCQPVIVADRQIEFIAYAGDEPVAEHIEPFDPLADTSAYQFELTAPAAAGAIERLTVAVCQERRSDGSSWPDRCGEAATVERDRQPEDDVRPYHYEFNLPDACSKGTVDATVDWSDNLPPHRRHGHHRTDPDRHRLRSGAP